MVVPSIGLWATLKEDRINVTEKANYELIFRNSGSFYYGTIEDYIFRNDFTPHDYLNPFLAEAMEKTGMIDTVGSGIRRIFDKQRKRYLPLPEYTLSDYVELTIFADNNNNEYTSLLFKHKNIDLGNVFLIDEKQKGFPIDDKDYKHVIISFLKQKSRAGRNDIDNLLLTQLDNELTIEQKKKKITNLCYYSAALQNTNCLIVNTFCHNFWLPFDKLRTGSKNSAKTASLFQLLTPS